MEKVIIVGTGCSGLTAAIYAARANFAPLVLEGHEPFPAILVNRRWELVAANSAAMLRL